jgi:putative DNA primase/helicase
MSDCLAAALRYAGRGWRVFPLHGKKPYFTGGFHKATTDRKQIRKWWRKWPTANVGIACDSQHGPIVVDVDGPSGLKLVEDLDLEETREASTGKKTKIHLYYAPTLDSTKIKRSLRPFKATNKNKGKNGKIEIDILGDGGYVVAPPSVHPDTGRKYKWDFKTSLAVFPEELLEMLKKAKKFTAAEPLPKKINEGERDNLLTSLAGTMRRRGASESAILAALREENETRVVPPLPDKDLRRIAKSIAKNEPAINKEHLTDLGNARRFIIMYEDKVRSVMANRRPWLLWDTQRWTPDVTGEVERMAKQVVRRIYYEAGQIHDEEERDNVLKHAARSESAPRIRAMLELAATEPELSTTTPMLDGNVWLFNVQNGTIDLRTGKMKPHDKNDLITKLAPVEFDPDATAPLWDKFLREVMQEDDELIDFLQRAVGYSLTGDTREQCLFFCYGQGSNGKSTFLETLRALFGEYARQSDFSTFLSSRGEGPRNDLARMHGARLVTASEADTERGFDARIIKLLTGDDTIVARKLYEELTEFRPQHKMFLAANHKPIVKEQTEGFWRRIRLIPFMAVFTKERRDKRLAKKLIKELPGILNWALEGCMMWRKEGLLVPKSVAKATHTYRDENDILGDFIGHACVIDPDGWTSSPELYRAFTDWWTDTRGPRSQPISMGWFSRLLSERPEFAAKKRKHLRGWKGLSLKLNSRT